LAGQRRFLAKIFKISPTDGTLRLLESQLRNLPDRVDEKASNVAESDFFKAFDKKLLEREEVSATVWKARKLLSQCSAHYRDSSRTMDKSSRSLLRKDDSRNSRLA
jgi:hypothetical protein